MQVAKKPKKRASDSKGVSEPKAKAGQEASAPEGAPKAKGRKRKVAGAETASAPPASILAGVAVGEARVKKRKKAQSTSEPKPSIRTEFSSSHAEPHSATEQSPAAGAQRTKQKPAGKGTKRATKAAVTITPTTDAKAHATDSQAGHIQAAWQKNQEVGVGGERDAAEHSDGEADVGDDMEADVADWAASTAAGVDARPKLTDEQRLERLQRTVFVGNLPTAVKAKRLKQAFTRCASRSLVQPWCSRIIAQ